MIKVYLRSVLFILIIFCIVGIIELEPWSQVAYLHGINFNLNNLTVGVITHFPRYAIVYPVYFINEITNIDLNKLFTLYVLICYYYSSIIWQKICFINKTPLLESIIKCSIPLILFLITNGRGAFIILGLSILMFNAIKGSLILKVSYFENLLGLLLISVSSGAFLNGFIFFAFTNKNIMSNQIKLFFRPILKCKLNINSSLAFLLITSITAFTSTYLILFVNKNILFYGGYNLSMLVDIISHGSGFIFNPDALIKGCENKLEEFVCSSALIISSNISIKFVVVLSAIIIIVIFLFYITKNKKLTSYAKIGFLSSIFSGFFGITAFLSILFVIPAIPIRDLRIKLKI